MTKPTTIVIVDDHVLFREGIRTLLAGETDMEVIGEAENGTQALERVKSLRPHIVLMDVSLPEMSGVESTRHIVQSARSTAVLALSMHIDKRFIEGMLQAGALGYVLKNCASEELKTAIRVVETGEIYLCPQAARIIVNHHVTRSANDKVAEAPHLTPRELETLQLIAEGKTAKEIAARLDVSIKTIETHRSRIMEKVGLRTVAELTKYAIKTGLTPLEH